MESDWWRFAVGAILIDDSNRAEAIPGGILISRKGEGMPGVEPDMLGVVTIR